MCFVFHVIRSSFALCFVWLMKSNKGHCNSYFTDGFFRACLTINTMTSNAHCHGDRRTAMFPCLLACSCIATQVIVLRRKGEIIFERECVCVCVRVCVCVCARAPLQRPISHARRTDCCALTWGNPLWCFVCLGTLFIDSFSRRSYCIDCS